MINQRGQNRQIENQIRPLPGGSSILYISLIEKKPL